MTEPDAFLTAFRGSFVGLLDWSAWDQLRERLRAERAGDWFIYAVGEDPPATPVTPSALDEFLVAIDALLRREHRERRLGIVYVDDARHPRFVKIFDPNNLGVVCGISSGPPLPGWILSQIPPVDLPAAFPPAAGRRRWWRRLFSSGEAS